MRDAPRTFVYHPLYIPSIGVPVQIMRPRDNLSASYAAVPDSVPVARQALAAFASAAGARPEQLDAIRLATSEALSNIVLHAYPVGSGAIHLSAALTPGALSVLVADDGCGLPARRGSAGLGLGLALISYVTDDLVIAKRSAGGTELRMRFDLGANGSSHPDAGRSRLS